MQKIKTLLVDDDYLVIQDLKNLVNWNELGFEIIGSATNGKTALEAAVSRHPELIITDISMPVMDGFDFIETLKEDFPDTYIIFISSYASFSYAQRAMENGIRDYILKNEISADLLEERLRKVWETLHSSRETSHARASHQLSDYFQLRTDKLPDSFSASRKYIFYFFSLHLPLEKLKSHFSHLSLYSEKMSISLQDYILSDHPHSFTAVSEEIFIAGISINDFDCFPGNTAVTALCRKFWTHAASRFSSDLTVWYCTEPLTLSQGRSLYQKALPYLHFFGSFPDDNIKNIALYKDRPFVPVRDTFPYHVLAESIDTPDNFFEQLNAYLTLIYQALDADSIFMLYHNLLIQMEELSNHMIPFQDTNYFYTQKDFYDFFYSCFQEIEKHNAGRCSSNYSVAVQSAISYMKKNFSDNELSVDQIAGEVFLSASRLSVLFKKETGQTVNDFLTDIRISQAIHLLENSNYKIYEIAEKTGYKSSQYFSQIFSQRTGRRPLAFRQKKPIL